MMLTFHLNPKRLESMTFRPLFFLPPSGLCWALNQAYSEHLMDHCLIRAVFCSIDDSGIWFPYKGDEVLWVWPWKRKNRPEDDRGKAPFISLNFSGTGEWGDARYWTLEELDKHWQEYQDIMNAKTEIDFGRFDDLVASKPLEAGELVKLMDYSKCEQSIFNVNHEYSSPIGRALERSFPTRDGQHQVRIQIK